MADSSNNTAVQQNRTVHVIRDTVRPVITLYGQANMTVYAGVAYVEPGYSAMDNVDGNITDGVVTTGMVNSTVLGTYTISYDVADSSNNTAVQQNRTVHVVPDTVRPVITLHGSASMTIPLGSPYVEPGYAATDNVDGNVTGSVRVTGAVNHTKLGTYTISYDVADGAGNPAITQNRTVHVADRTPPVITLYGQANITMPLGSTYIEPGYSATDNVDGNVTGRVAVSGAVNGNKLGAYTISYDVADDAGNAAMQQNRTVHVVPDTVRPVIVLHGNASMTIPFGSTYAEPGYSATDNVDGNITGKVAVSGAVNGNKLGAYTISYDVSDSSNNTAIQQNRTVHVADKTPPVITLYGQANMTIALGSKYVEPGYSATDNVDGNVTGSVRVTGAVNHTKVGTYAISYDVADGAGNAAMQQSRTVNVVSDTVRPVITLSGPAKITMYVGNYYVEPGYAATDNIDGDITAKVKVTGTVNILQPGTYTLTYSVTDSSGNAAVSKTRTVVMEQAWYGIP